MRGIYFFTKEKMITIDWQHTKANPLLAIRNYNLEYNQHWLTEEINAFH